MDKVLKIILLVLAALVVIIILVLLIVYLRNLYITKKAAKIARTKCEEYVKQICDDSNPKNKPPSKNESAPIMGGTLASDGQLPHMAQYSGISKDKAQSCSGSIISEYFVVTGGHCVYNFKNDEMFVIVGFANILDAIKLKRIYRVDEVYLHPDYNNEDKRTIPNDIALLKLNKKIEFDWKTRPICLNYDFKSISTANLTVSGWGTNEYGNFTSTVLWVETYVDGEITKKCIETFGKQLLEVLYCAGHPTERKGPCPGDSGGPLQIPLKNGCLNTYEQIGVAQSILGDCTANTTETQLALYVKVELMLVWIVSTVWPDLM